MTLKYFNVKNGLVTGNITLDATSSNVTANTFIGNISVTTSANLGNVGNITITGGSSGQVLSTNGSGSLSWVTPTSSNVSLQLPSVSVDSFIADGSNNSFTLTETPNSIDYVFVNVDGVFQFRDSFTLSGNVLTFGSIPETASIIEIRTLIPGQASSGGSANTIFNGSSNVNVLANSDVTISSNGTANIVKVSSSAITIAADLIPSANVTYDLGSPSNSFRDLYLSGSTIYFGGAKIKADSTTGAIALIPQPTANTPNPTGIVITTAGTISTVVTSAGNISNTDFSNVVANTPSFASVTYVDDSIANLVNSAPSALNTLNELATALGNDASFSTTITNTLANKLNTNAFTYANITGAPTLGNIVTINKDGNSSNILYGNGVFASAPVTYANANVAAYLPTYTGNLSPGNLTVSLGNLKISGGTANYVIKTDGLGNLSWAAQSGGASTISYVKEYVWRGGLTENTGTLRHYIHATSTLTGIYAYLVSGGLTQSTVVVKKNGTSINTITIPANSTNVNQSGLSISLAAGDYLTVDITQSSSASDLYINFVYQG